MTDSPVTAISWGDWRAAFTGVHDDAQHYAVALRLHRVRGAPLPPTIATVTDDPSEAGLRACIWAQSAQDSSTQTLIDANPTWAAQFTPPADAPPDETPAGVPV